MSQPVPGWRRLAAYAGTAFAGVMFLAAGLLKGLDPGGFATQIAADVPALSGFAHPLAILGIAVETLLGTALLLGFRRRLLVGAGCLMVLLFLAVTFPKLGSDDPTGCGCFGNFVVRTPAQVMTEDLIMLGGLLLGFVGGAGSRLTRWRGGGLAVALLLGVGLPLAAPSLPLDNIATRLKPGASLADLQLLEAVPDLAHGQQIVILGGAKLDSCATVPESLDRFIAGKPQAQVWILRPSDVLSQAGSMWICLPGVEIVEVPVPILKPLYRTLPRSLLAEDGLVLKTWSGLPADGS